MSRRGLHPFVIPAAVAAVIVAIIIGAIWWNYNHSPVEGTVVHKQQSDAYWYQTTSCSGSGSSFSCHTTSNYMPERWELCVEGHDRHGRIAEDCVGVSKGSWFSHNEGSEWHR